MASMKKRLNGISKEHQKDVFDTNGQKYAVIEDQTATAIATEEQPQPVTNRGPVVSNSSPPPNQQQPPPQLQFTRPKDYSRGKCRMFFPTSGHMGFQLVKTSDEFPSIETIREMIAYEIRIRLCEPIQELMDMYHTDEAAIT
jgi:hypothetical protein